MTDLVRRDIFIAAPPERVWQALTADWGAWFRTTLDAPFAPGRTVSGEMTMPGAEGLPFKARVEAMEPPRRFAFRWPQWDFEAGRDLSGESWTLVEFDLAAEDGGTRVTVTESGFSAFPGIGERLARENGGGWEIQLGNLAAFVAGAADAR